MNKSLNQMSSLLIVASRVPEASSLVDEVSSFYNSVKNLSEEELMSKALKIDEYNLRLFSFIDPEGYNDL